MASFDLLRLFANPAQGFIKHPLGEIKPTGDQIRQDRAGGRNQAASFRRQHDAEGAAQRSSQPLGTTAPGQVVDDDSQPMFEGDDQGLRLPCPQSPRRDGLRYWQFGMHAQPIGRAERAGGDIRWITLADLPGHRRRHPDLAGEGLQQPEMVTSRQQDQR